MRGSHAHAEEKWKALWSNRWLVFVCAMWVQSCAGVGYLFGSISPVIKSTMGYNQRQVALLGVAKDLGDSVGFLAGALCEVLPVWALLLIGAVQNFVGYGLLWLIVIQKLPGMPLWVIISLICLKGAGAGILIRRDPRIYKPDLDEINMFIEPLCLAIFVGTNGETYFNTASLVACVKNFPKNRGPVVGILKGFAGLSGAILTQVYALINAPNEASLIFMVAVGPSMVVIALMFIVRPVKGHKQARPYDDSRFLFVYSVCLILAAYLLGVLILEDMVSVSQTVIDILVVILIILILLPIVIPVLLVFFSEAMPPAEESLIPEPEKGEEEETSDQELDRSDSEVILSEVESEVEDERNREEMETLTRSERQKRISQLQSKLFQAAAEGAVRIKRRRTPHRGEDFTLMQALIKADFLLLFLSLILAAGSGVTVIDNLGQISASLGYTDTSMFVSMISIWNFLGRVGGGYFSEIVIRNFAYPRPVTMAVVQVIMAIGLLYYSMGWPGEIYVLSIMIGLGYGAHWAIVPAAVSELFGLKSFGALYNFLTLACPAGSLIFSGVLASGFYDYYAEKQSSMQLLSSRPLHHLDDDSLSCEGSICYSITFAILSGLCIVAMILSLIVVHRTKGVYAQLYGMHNA